jgi:hypothetical protein
MNNKCLCSHVLRERPRPSRTQAISHQWLTLKLVACVRRHRRAQGGSSTLRSIRPKRAVSPALDRTIAPSAAVGMVHGGGVKCPLGSDRPGGAIIMVRRLPRPDESRRTEFLQSHAAGQKPTLGCEHRFRCARPEESCIRKAVAERGLTPAPVGLADTTAEDEAATGTAFALM